MYFWTYKHFPHIMYYIWLLIIVASCTAAQRCANSSNMNTYNKKTYHVSGLAFDRLFTDAVVTRSRTHCLTLCIANGTNAYYESNRNRCRCQGLCVSYTPVSTGRNYVERYSAHGKSLNIHPTMLLLSYFWTYNDLYQC